MCYCSSTTLRMSAFLSTTIVVVTHRLPYRVPSYVRQVLVDKVPWGVTDGKTEESSAVMNVLH
jgi:hypothetical protein